METLIRDNQNLRVQVEWLEETLAKINRVAPGIVEQAREAPPLDHFGYGGRATADGDPWGVSLRAIRAVREEWDRREVPLPELERRMHLPRHSTRNIARMAGRAIQELLGFPI
jgi:hypothetical protein